MSILGRLLRTRPTDSIADPTGFLAEYYGGAKSKTGVSVTPTTALRVVAVFACQRIGAETLGSLPLHVYERRTDGGKQRAYDHPYYSLLHDSPNADMTSLEWREAQQGFVEGRGNGVAQLVWGNNGRLSEIIPLDYSRITPARAKASSSSLETGGDLPLVYKYARPDGTERIFPADQILHVRCFGSNGIVGYSPIAQAREAIAIAMAAEEHWARFFSQGQASKIALQHPKTLSPQAHRNIRESWVETYAGLGNAHKPLIAEEGMTVVNLPINFEDLQFLETRKFQITEIARLFRIPPHMIADLTNATFSNIEHQSLEFVIHSMLPRVARWEQRLNRMLFTGAEAGKYFVEFSLDGLLRGDIKSRFEALQIARRNGIISGNDWADLENLNHFEGGELRTIESNMTRLEWVGQTPQKSDPSARDVVRMFQPVMAAAVGRSLRREAKALASLAKKVEKDRTPALAQFYEEHRNHLAEQLAPIVETLSNYRGAKLPAERVDTLAGEIIAEHRRLAEESAAAGTLETLAENWETSRAERLATRTLETLTA